MPKRAQPDVLTGHKDYDVLGGEDYLKSRVDRPISDLMQKIPAPDKITYTDRELKVTKTTVLTEKYGVHTAENVELFREELLHYFHRTFQLYERVFDALVDDEAFMQRPEALRHPLIFYYGHTAVFYINKMNLAKLIPFRINTKMESTLAIGVDEMSWDCLDNVQYDWPSPAQVKAYRDRARDIVDHVIRTCPVQLPVTWDNPLWVVLMGIEHERIHLETSTVLFRQLDMKHIRADDAFWAPCERASHDADAVPRNELLHVPGGAVDIGKSRQASRTYGWDNEYGTFRADVPSFAASKYLVSNREFLDFMRAGGYAKQAYWTDEGWRWKSFRKAEQPTFWIAQPDGSYKYRSMTRELPMPWDWPVDVNYFEAKAFCNWKAATSGKHIRLPAEDEWARMRDLMQAPDQPDWLVAPGNINLEHYASSCPVDVFQSTASGLFDVVGNVWHWTETPIDGFKGFKEHRLYDDFSLPTFDTRHNMIKGGSWISTGNEATYHARYAFRRHFFQHAGFRYVESDRELEYKQTVYEHDDAAAQSSELHFADSPLGTGNFFARVAQLALDASKGRQRALELGCGVGRTSFELARHFTHVTALDFSARFVQVASTMQRTGTISYYLQDEGDLATMHTRTLAELKLDEHKSKIEFFQNDPCNLDERYTDYDLIVASNMLDRLYKPRAFLDSIHERVRQGGVLLLGSSYSWNADITPKDEWNGGYVDAAGNKVTTLEGITRHLSKHFAPLGKPVDVPLVVYETQRRFHYHVVQLTAWQRVL